MCEVRLGGCDKYTSVIDRGVINHCIFLFVRIERTLVYGRRAETAAETVWQHLLFYNCASVCVRVWVCAHTCTAVQGVHYPGQMGHHWSDGCVFDG